MSSNDSSNLNNRLSQNGSANSPFAQAAEGLIQRIQNAETENPLELAKLAGLDPSKDFAGQDLKETNLSGADLSGFDLSSTNLNGADLSRADLRNANLLYADLSRANLSGAIVTNARLGWNHLPESIQIELARKGARWEEGIQEVLQKWEEFTPSDRDWMVAHGENRYLETGDILIRQGMPIDTIHMVLRGSLDVLGRNSDESDRATDTSIASIFAAEMVGEMSFVKNRPPSATLKAKQNTLVWSIPRSKLMEKLAHDSEFGYRFHRAISAVLAHRLRETTLKLLNQERDNDLNASQALMGREALTLTEHRRDDFIRSGRAKLAVGGMLEVQGEQVVPI